MATWIRAGDIAARIGEIVKLLGTQVELARRAGVRDATVSDWVNGNSKPAKTRLKKLAEQQAWPLEIFEEGGRRPRELVNAPLTGLEEAGTGQGSTHVAEVSEMRAAVAAVRRLLDDEYSTSGRLVPAAVVQEWVTMLYETSLREVTRQVANALILERVAAQARQYEEKRQPEHILGGDDGHDRLS